MWAFIRLVFSLIFTSILVLGCTVKTTTTVSGGRISPTYQGPTETSYCSSSIAYGGTTSTVSGTAQYTKRNIWGNLASGGLGSASTTGTHPATNNPIRRAEVRVTDASGTVVQCTETLNDGSFSFVLPRNSSTYTVSVNSRASNSHVVASVLNRPEQNTFYSLSTTVVPSGAAVNVGTLTAAANGDVLGGAFNILDQILKSNEYLRAQVTACGFALCTNFTVAPKVVAYWEKGFNPNDYFGSSAGLSFYLPDYSRLFILGGVNGNVDTADTDHYDDSVIIHEYGHFLEDTMFRSDSPGGQHNGDKVIDPRLAMSEGWGNFFQGAVRGIARYTDTYGNDDGSTGMYFNVDLETADRDVPLAAGEGNFREFSVTRLLWDAIDAAADTANAATDNVVSGKFNEIWAALTKTTDGFRDADYAFRNIGHLHIAQQLLGGSNWSTIRTIERHDGNTGQYAQYRVASGACADVTLTPIAGSSSLSSSDLFRNNDFYHIKIASAGSYTLRLDYTDADAGGTEADLDLYLYNESARFGNSSDIVRYSRQTPDGNAATAQFETFTVSLSAGVYLINVNAYVGSQTGTAANYSLSLNGVPLCPGTL